MRPGKAASFTFALLLVSVPAVAQRGNEANHGRDRDNSSAYQNSRRDEGSRYGGDQHSRRDQNFYRGVREGGHGGQYYEPRHANDGYDRRYHEQGGIGPGKGALIGGAGGAVLGAVFGGGLKGTLIGGAAGAGIGAIVGEATQNNRRDRDRDHRR
jgi:hypothetical protein